MATKTEAKDINMTRDVSSVKALDVMASDFNDLADKLGI